MWIAAQSVGLSVAVEGPSRKKQRKRASQETQLASTLIYEDPDALVFVEDMECLDLCVLFQVISLCPPGICALLSGAKQLTLILTPTHILVPPSL